MALAYKSFCWSMGTTSFRTKHINRDIELQLRYLHTFWESHGQLTADWSDCSVQAAYYTLLKQQGFVEGSASRPDKDAREKTSGLVDLGLLTEGRQLTEAGKRLWAISEAQDFAIDPENLLDLAKDSTCYFLQLLKAASKEGASSIRPFVVLLDVLNKVAPNSQGKRYLTQEEFVYLLPLCVNPSRLSQIVGAINRSRAAGQSFDLDAEILKVLMGMENHQEALALFLKATQVDERLICQVGMNRKSGADGDKRYDKAYLGIFKTLHEIVFQGVTEERLRAFLDAVKACNRCREWKQVFGLSGKRKQLIEGWRADLAILQATTEADFRKRFFELMHLLKAKATLHDYADLNKRYFRLADVVVFADDRIYLDLLPSVFVKHIAAWLDREAFAPCHLLDRDVPLADLIPLPLPSKTELVLEATGLSTEKLREAGGIRSVLQAKRYARFKALLHHRFPIETVRELLEMVEDRKRDKAVQELITKEADLPTLFEYIVALAWYYISGETGEVLDYMNLSLGADFMPKTHAGGGEADIVWHYEADPPYYPRHQLLIEVTLAEKDAQRRMEMEPVSRHLGEYLLSSPDHAKAYCTFIAPHLNPNVISDFRMRKAQVYYRASDCTQTCPGMKIIPLDTQMLRQLLGTTSYRELYARFEEHFHRAGDPLEWHNALRQELTPNAPAAT